MSRIKVDRITDRAGTGEPLFPNGVKVVGLTSLSNVVAGIATFENVSVGGTLTYEDVTNIDSVGLITARTGLKVTAGGIDVTAGGINVTAGGINVTAGDVDITNGSLGVGLNNPGLKLHIQDGALPSAPAPNSNCDVVIEGTTNTGIQFLSGGQTQLRFGDADSNAAGSIIYKHAEDNFRLNFSNSGYLSLNDGGGENIRFTPNNEIGIAGANYGTSGQVLTSGGSGAAVQWADAGGGEWTLLGSSSGDISNGTDTIDITTTLITSTYYRYKLVFNLNCDSGIASGKMGFRVRVNNSWESAAYYRTGFRATSGSMSNAANDRAMLVEDDIRVLCGEMILWNPSTASNRPHDIFMSGFALNNRNLVNSSGYWVNQSYIQVDQNNSTNYPITGIQFRTQRTIVDYNPDGAQRTFWVLYGAKT